MKNIFIYLCLLLPAIYAIPAQAQVKYVNRDATFHQLPSTIDLSDTDLSMMLNTATGQQISIKLQNNFVVTGTVTSNEIKYANLQTVVIKLPAFGNALLSISRQSDRKKYHYVGRMFDAAYASGYVLNKIKSSNYQLVKINAANTLTDCKLK
jgi:hypothetical protein